VDIPANVARAPHEVSRPRQKARQTIDTTNIFDVSEQSLWSLLYETHQIP
jgi:hypothetical protein